MPSLSKNPLVIVPTHNEAPNIEPLLRKVFGLRQAFDVLVVDDHSTDETLAHLRAHVQYGKRLRVIARNRKEGIGPAYLCGFAYALANDYRYVLQMDADMSHNPEDLPRLLKICEEQNYDLAIGSRYVSGVNVVNWPMSRVLLSYFASRYVRWVTGLPIQDTTAGFVCYRSELLQTLMQEPIRFVGYAFQIEMKYHAWRHRARIYELSVIFTDRVRGKSKMSMGIFREAFFGVLWLRLQGLWRRYSSASGVASAQKKASYGQADAPLSS